MYHSRRKQIELLLGEVRIDLRKWNHVEREIPRREPGIFPFVRHRDDVAIEKMSPFAVAADSFAPAAARLRGIAIEPVANDVIVKLLAPEQTRVALTRNLHRSSSMSGGRNRVVKFIRFFHALGKDLIEIGQGHRLALRRFAESRSLTTCDCPGSISKT